MKVPLPLPGLVWHVEAREFPDGDAAHDAWKKVVEGLPEGDISAWRVMDGGYTVHAVVVCGREAIVDRALELLEGEPSEISEDEAHAFALRRLRGISLNEATGIDGHITSHGKKGGVLNPDGTITPRA